MPASAAHSGQQRQRLAGILGGNPAGHDAHEGFGVFKPMVELRELRVEGVVPSNASQAAVHFAMAFEGTFGKDHPFRVLLEPLFWDGPRLGEFRQFKEGGGMTDAGGGTHDDGGVVTLRQLEGLLHHGEAFFWRGGVQYRHFGEGGEAAGVLFCLRRDGAGVIGYEQY